MHISSCFSNGSVLVDFLLYFTTEQDGADVVKKMLAAMNESDAFKQFGIGGVNLSLVEGTVVSQNS